MPTDTYTTPERKIFFNNEGVELIHVPAAHTDGDTIVFFRRSDVISTGDIFVTNGYPIVDLDRGGNIQGVIAGLNRIVELAIPADEQEGGTLIVPGHGRLCDVADVVYYQEMVIIIRDRIQDMIKKGMTLDQVKAAQPTRDYDPRFGSATGFWTTEKFVTAVYKSLSAQHLGDVLPEYTVNRKCLALLTPALLLMGAPVHAHHSFAATYFVDQEITHRRHADPVHVPQPALLRKSQHQGQQGAGADLVSRMGRRCAAHAGARDARNAQGWRSRHCHRQSGAGSE